MARPNLAAYSATWVTGVSGAVTARSISRPAKCPGLAPVSAKSCLSSTAPIEVPGDLDRDGLERHRLEAQAAMDDVQRRAEQLSREKTTPAALLTLQQMTES